MEGRYVYYESLELDWKRTPSNYIPRMIIPPRVLDMEWNTRLLCRVLYTSCKICEKCTYLSNRFELAKFVKWSNEEANVAADD